MSNKQSNFPNAQKVNADPGEIGFLVEKMDYLRELKKPQTDDEIEERIKFFFQWCADNDCRPGVELLALALGTNRMTLWKWQQQDNRRGHLIMQAKQLLAALLESWSVNGKINPVTSIFLLKNHFGYRDATQLEVEQANVNTHRSIEEIARDRGIALKDLKSCGEDPDPLQPPEALPEPDF